MPANWVESTTQVVRLLTLGPDAMNTCDRLEDMFGKLTTDDEELNGGDGMSSFNVSIVVVGKENRGWGRWLDGLPLCIVAKFRVRCSGLRSSATTAGARIPQQWK